MKSTVAAALAWVLVCVPAPVVLGQQPFGADASAVTHKAAAAMATLRGADGHPDLSGYWENPNSFSVTSFGNKDDQPKDPKVISVMPKGADVASVNASDALHVAQRKANKALRPKYKAEFAAKAAENFEAGDLVDPTYGCVLPGVARLGFPAEIYQRPGSVVLLYEGLVNRFRVVPTDGRKLDPDADDVPLGHPVGHWEGDTLVIDTSGFVDGDWLDRDGSYYTNKLHLTERLTRRGNTLQYEMVADDPMFAEPFKSRSQLLSLATSATHIADEYGCVEKDIPNMVNGTKH